MVLTCAGSVKRYRLAAAEGIERMCETKRCSISSCGSHEATYPTISPLMLDFFFIKNRNKCSVESNKKI